MDNGHAHYRNKAAAPQDILLVAHHGLKREQGIVNIVSVVCIISSAVL